MKKMYLMKGMAVLAMGLVVAGCNKLDFANQAQISDEEALENAEMQLGATIDPNQDWKMTKDVQGTVSVNLGTGKEYTLLVFDKNPFVNDNAVYYLKQTITDGSKGTYTVTVPSAQKQLYVTVIDDKNYSYSKYVFFSDDNAFTANLSTEAKAPAMRRANTGTNEAETSTGINANANEWADAADAPHGHGGWLVPDPLTADQKEIVRKYFQAVPNRTYEDPHLRHFFVQQVYKGGTSAPETGNKEDNVAADGTTHYTSANMNLLTVGKNNQHINNFNNGTYSGTALSGVDGFLNDDGSVNVLDKDHTVNEFAQYHHPDQIMLMVNIEDTECMGFHNTGSSFQQNNKAGLVDWKTIRDWARQNKLYTEDILNDGWNRSFVGFDFELYSLEQSYLKDDAGNKIYAQFTDGQNSGLQYVWNGTEVLKKATQSAPRRSAKAKRARRAGTTYANLWGGNEEKANNNAISASFSDAAKTLLVAGNFIGADVSVVTAWEWGTYNDWRVKFQGSWGSALGYGEITLDSNTTNVEIQLTNDDIAIIEEQGLQALVINHPVIFTRIYISEYSQSNGVGRGTNIDGNTDSGNTGSDNTGGSDNNDENTQNDDNLNTYTGGNYLVVNGNQVPFLISNTNMYGGTKRTISDNDMKIEKDGRWCFNMKTIADLVGEGYLPVQNTNLRDWVKWQGGDGYYSDWIVTLTEAKRQPDTQTHEDPIDPQPNVYSYAFEDTKNGDYDMNDVVLKVKENGDNIDVWLVAAGATLDLTIKLYEYDANNAAGNYYGSSYRTLEYNGQSEIHLMWGVDPGTMVNTNAGASATPIRIAQLAKSDGYEADKLRFSINSNVWEVKLSGSGQAPYGVMIPVDWRWPTERMRITKAYNNKNTQETEADQSFTNFMGNAGHAELWYKYPTTSTMIVDIPE